MSQQSLLIALEFQKKNIAMMSEQAVLDSISMQQMAWQMEQFLKTFNDVSLIDELAECCFSFIHLISKYSLNHPDPNSNKHKHAIFKCMNTLSIANSLPCLHNQFLQSIRCFITNLVCDPTLTEECGIEVLRFFNNTARNSDKDVRHQIGRSAPFEVFKLADVLTSCGSYEYQVQLLECIFLICSKETISLLTNAMYPEAELLQRAMNIFNTKEFDKSARTFLNIVNSIYNNISSVIADQVHLDEISVSGPMGLNNERYPLWIDFNTRSIAFFCDCDSFSTSLSLSEDSETISWELVTIYYSNIVNTTYTRSRNASSRSTIFKFFLKNEFHVMFTSSSQVTSSKVLSLTFSNNETVNKVKEDILPKITKVNIEDSIHNSTNSSILNENGPYYGLSKHATSERKSISTSHNQSDKSLCNMFQEEYDEGEIEIDRLDPSANGLSRRSKQLRRKCRKISQTHSHNLPSITETGECTNESSSTDVQTDKENIRNVDKESVKKIDTIRMHMKQNSLENEKVVATPQKKVLNDIQYQSLEVSLNNEIICSISPNKSETSTCHSNITELIKEEKASSLSVINVERITCPMISTDEMDENLEAVCDDKATLQQQEEDIKGRNYKFGLEETATYQFSSAINSEINGDIKYNTSNVTNLKSETEYTFLRSVLVKDKDKVETSSDGKTCKTPELVKQTSQTAEQNLARYDVNRISQTIMVDEMMDGEKLYNQPQHARLTKESNKSFEKQPFEIFNEQTEKFSDEQEKIKATTRVKRRRTAKPSKEVINNDKEPKDGEKNTSSEENEQMQKKQKKMIKIITKSKPIGISKFTKAAAEHEDKKMNVQDDVEKINKTNESTTNATTSCLQQASEVEPLSNKEGDLQSTEVQEFTHIEISSEVNKGTCEVNECIGASTSTVTQSFPKLVRDEVSNKNEDSQHVGKSMTASQLGNQSTVSNKSKHEQFLLKLYSQLSGPSTVELDQENLRQKGKETMPKLIDYQPLLNSSDLEDSDVNKLPHNTALTNKLQEDTTKKILNPNMILSYLQCTTRQEKVMGLLQKTEHGEKMDRRLPVPLTGQYFKPLLRTKRKLYDANASPEFSINDNNSTDQSFNEIPSNRMPKKIIVEALVHNAPLQGKENKTTIAPNKNADRNQQDRKEQKNIATHKQVKKKVAAVRHKKSVDDIIEVVNETEVIKVQKQGNNVTLKQGKENNPQKIIDYAMDASETVLENKPKYNKIKSQKIIDDVEDAKEIISERPQRKKNIKGVLQDVINEPLQPKSITKQLEEPQISDFDALKMSLEEKMQKERNTDLEKAPYRCKYQKRWKQGKHGEYSREKQDRVTKEKVGRSNIPKRELKHALRTDLVNNDYSICYENEVKRFLDHCERSMVKKSTVMEDSTLASRTFRDFSLNCTAQDGTGNDQLFSPLLSFAKLSRETLEEDTPLNITTDSMSGDDETSREQKKIQILQNITLQRARATSTFRERYSLGNHYNAWNERVILDVLKGVRAEMKLINMNVVQINEKQRLIIKEIEDIFEKYSSTFKI